MGQADIHSKLEEELMLQINEHLFQTELLTKEMYEQAKNMIVGRRFSAAQRL